MKCGKTFMKNVIKILSKNIKYFNETYHDPNGKNCINLKKSIILKSMNKRMQSQSKEQHNLSDTIN